MIIQFTTKLSDNFCHYLIPISKHSRVHNYTLPGMPQIKFFNKTTLDLKSNINNNDLLVKAHFDYVFDSNLNAPPLCRSVSFEMSFFKLAKGKDYNVLLSDNGSKEYDPKYPIILPCNFFFYVTNRFHFQRIDDLNIPIFSRGLQSFIYPIFEFLNVKHTTTLNKNTPGILSIPELSLFHILIQSSSIPLYEKYISTIKDLNVVNSSKIEPPLNNIGYGDDIFCSTHPPEEG